MAVTDGICPFARQVKGVESFATGYVDRVGFCDHTAQGFFGTLVNPTFWNDGGTSVHFAISRDGEIAQIVNIFDTAFAQGRLGPTVSWPRFQDIGRRNPNGFLISTEHEDYTLVNGKPTAVVGSEWTEAQYAADLRVKRWCVEEARRVAGKNLLTFGLDSLAGHHMFDAVDRAECPGRFWRDLYRARLFADLQEAPMPRRFIAGDANGGLEVAGRQLLVWNGGVCVLAIGTYEGQYPGRIAKLFGDRWFWLRKGSELIPGTPDLDVAVWSGEAGD